MRFGDSMKWLKGGFSFGKGSREGLNFLCKREKGDNDNLESQNDSCHSEVLQSKAEESQDIESHKDLNSDYFLFLFHKENLIPPGSLHAKERKTFIFNKSRLVVFKQNLSQRYKSLRGYSLASKAPCCL
ncbi:hypothetical protein [Helicobacter aurati]|nr:hypothetical protein [Helicobacter aurati]